MPALPRSCFLYGEKLDKRRADVAALPAGRRPAFGLFTDVHWGDWDDEGDGYLDEQFGPARALGVPVVVRFQIVHPDKGLPRALRAKPGAVGGSRANPWPTPAGWDVLLAGPHRAQLEELATYLKRHGLTMPWVELGSHGIWGEGHFNSDQRAYEGAWPGPDVPRRILDDYRAVFAGETAVFAFDWLLQPAQAGSPGRDPADGVDLGLLAALRAAFSDLHVRFDALGGGDGYVGPFRETLAKMTAAGWSGSWVAETADRATVPRAIAQAREIPGFAGIAGRVSTNGGPLRLFERLLAGDLWPG